MQQELQSLGARARGDSPSVGAAEAAGATITFIVVLRAVASLLVAWDHLLGSWADEKGVVFLPSRLVRDYVTTPLAIIQDFGYLGVALFFFVSGYIITHVAQSEDRRTFVVKRLFRIYPPLIVSILVMVALTSLRPGSFRPFTPAEIFLGMTLLNYVTVPQVIIAGVAWTLAIEAIFYALCALCLPLLRRQQLLATAILTGFCLAVILCCKLFGDSFFLFAALVAYLPLLLLGQLTYFVSRRMVGARSFAVCAFALYLVYVLGLRRIHTEFYPPDNAYAVSAAYAYALFIAGLLLNAHVRVPRVLQFVSTISYSFYLYHGFFGRELLLALIQPIGLPAGLALALGGAVGISYLSWRLVELPSQRLARQILAPRRRERPG